MSTPIAMAPCGLARPLVPLLQSAALLFAAGAALSAPVSISTPFMNLENRNINSLGFSTGEFLRIGANAVIPNGNSGTTGVGTTTDLVTGLKVARSIPFTPGPVIPNFFQRLMPDSPGLRGPWTLTFTNGASKSSVVVDIADDATQARFINSVTLSGTSDHPTFTWSPYPGSVVNGYRVNIYDKSLVSSTSVGVVATRNLLPSTTSYTVTDSDFAVPGYAFTLGKNYSIEISIIQTKDGSSTNLLNSNVKAIARSYADFTPSAGTGPVVNLPVVLADGSYKFNMTVNPGQIYYIDPAVAVGYDYAIGAGDPNFTSVDLPDAIGDGRYDIFGFDFTGAAELLAHDWLGTDVFNFGGLGISRFRVTGIETGANLDPGNVTAFVTGLTFSSSGNFTGTQTPITATLSAAPEPPSMAFLGLCLLGFSLRLRQQRH